MKLTVLGARGAYPNKDEGCSGYLIQKNEYNILIDCGSGVVSTLQNYIGLRDLNEVIISHYHADHYSDISVLQHGIMIDCKVNKKNKNLSIYGHQNDKVFTDLSYKNYTTGKAYQENSQLKLGPFIVSFLKTKHSIPCYAIQIICNNKKIIYTADTAYFDKLVTFSKNADLLISECSLYPGVEGQQMGHMNSTDAANLAKNANVKMLLLSHLPNYGDNKELFKDASKSYTGKINMGNSGWHIDIW